LLAVETIPFRPDNIPFDGKSAFDSDEILELEHLPK
jgi:NAD(P) transhydrogenase